MEGPNIEDNRARRAQQAMARQKAWATAPVGVVPTSVRIKNEKRAQQRGKAAAAATLTSKSSSSARAMPMSAPPLKPPPLRSPPPKQPQQPRPPPLAAAAELASTATDTQASQSSGSEPTVIGIDWPEPLTKKAKPQPKPLLLVPTPPSVRPFRKLEHIRDIKIVSHDRWSCCWANDRDAHIQVKHLFYDKPKDAHDGRHESVQTRLLTNHTTNFLKVCVLVKEIRESCRESTLTINFVCNQGKHRSVACAELIGSICNDIGIPSVNVWRKSLEKHYRECKCRACNDPRCMKYHNGVPLVQMFKDA